VLPVAENLMLVFKPGAYPGGAGGPPPPIFVKVNFIFYIVYNVLKIFLKLNLDFIVAEIRGDFESVGVYACVNRNRGRYCFLFCKGPILNNIRGHADPINICQIAGNRI